MRRPPRFALILSILVLVPSVALATVNHGDFIGTGVDFLAVSETTQTAGDAEPLWGAPTLAGSGDQLLFFPSAFISSCTPGTSDITSSLLETEIVAQAGGTIERFALVEAGDVTLLQFPPPGSPTTNASATVSGFLTVIETTAGPITPVVIPFSGIFTPSGAFSLPGNFGTSTWQGVIDVDVASVVANATRAQLSLDNTLDSNCGVGNTSAHIQKKVVSGPSVAIMVNPIDCDLTLEKTCCIPQPIKPSDGEDICDGKAVRAVFEITGGECGDTTNDQHGKARCTGPDPIVDPAGDLVTVTVTHKPNKILVNGQTSPVLVDLAVSNTIEFTSTTGQLLRKTRFKIAGPGGTQHVKINTACKKPLRCDDQFGAVKLVELESTLGGTVSCNPGVQTGTTCGAPSGGVGTPCDAKLTEAVFRFSPSACQISLPNPQNGKASCDGDASDANLSVSVTYTGKKRSKVKVSPSSGIQDGDLVTVSAIGHKPGLPSNLKLLIQDDDSVEQALEIHVSCSQQLACGDTFGSLELLGFKTKNGTEVSCDQAPPPLFLDTCEVPAAPPKPHCTGSLEEIQLAYLGNLFGSDCSVSNPQGGQATCTGDDLWDEDVSIAVLSAGVEADPISGIGVRGLFSVTPINSWEALPSGLDFTATDASGNTQTVWIRTDCEESLDLGDRFGDFVVFGLDRGDGDQHNGHYGCDSDSDSDSDSDAATGTPGEDGLITLGGVLEYQYKVTNLSDVTVDVNVVDDPNIDDGDATTVPVGSITLAPGAMETFFLTRTLYESTTNRATASGTEVTTGTMCVPGVDEVPVTVVLPPTGSFDCKDAKPIDELSMEWAGSQDVCVVAYDGAVGGTILSTQDDVQPGDIVAVSGMGGSPNDQEWAIFAAGDCGGAVIGTSKFHISCSDSNMNGVEDCGKNQGNGKPDDPGLVNDWLLEGISGDEILECTPVVIPWGGGGGGWSCGIGFELAALIPGLMWLHGRRRRKTAA